MKSRGKPEKALRREKAREREIIDGFVKKMMYGLSRLECAVCGRVNAFDLYMLRDALWKKAGFKPGDFCCLDCLSARLGREPAIGDFDAGAPLNRPLVFGYLTALKDLERKKGRASPSRRIPDLPKLPRARKRAGKPGG